MQPTMKVITPQDYATLRAGDAPPILIDVREPWEFAIARLDEATLLPIGEAHEWAPTLDKEADYVVVCHHGQRSAAVCQFLAGQGFKRVANLSGGMDAWSIAVDRTVPRY
jgi:adenylyltransferase/sulfurtransferase